MMKNDFKQLWNIETKKEWIYKKLNDGEKNIFNEFKEPIYEFLSDLDKKGLLNLEIKKDDAIRFLFYKKSLDSLIDFYNFSVDNQKYLKDNGGIDPSVLPYIGAHFYQTFYEKLKLSFTFFVKVDELGLGKNPFLGAIIGDLKRKYEQNKFISELSTKNRNSIAHYTYYIKGSKICLCDNFSDENPRCLEYTDFEKQVKKLNIIVDLFIATILDDFLAKWIDNN